MSFSNGTRPAGRQFLRLPEGWESTVDNEGQVYYFNRATSEVQWNRPEGPIPDELSESGMASVRGRANSVVSTNASDNGGDVPVCGCSCQTDRARQLGPRIQNRHAARCRCPFCGHRSSSGGQGCHRRIRCDPLEGALCVCRDCARHCLAILILEEQNDAGGRT